jgi:EAL domain-containing protein (putative c-di-GMP-specific phosphodiesterase class I)
LKVDRSFVCRITEGERQDRIVHSIVNLALDLGMSATAEGVELAEEYKRLKEMGCPRVQGFFFSKPMTSTDATAWLDQHCKQGGRR